MIAETIILALESLSYVLQARNSFADLLLAANAQNVEVAVYSLDYEAHFRTILTNTEMPALHFIRRLESFGPRAVSRTNC